MPGGVVCDLVITEAREPIVQTAKDSKEMDPDLFEKAWWHVRSWMAADIEARKRQKADKLFKRQLLRQSFSRWFQNTDFMPALVSSSDESHYVGGGYGPDEGGEYGSSSDSGSDSSDMVPTCWQEIVTSIAAYVPVAVTVLEDLERA